MEETSEAPQRRSWLGTAGTVALIAATFFMPIGWIATGKPLSDDYWIIAVLIVVFWSKEAASRLPRSPN